MTRTWSEVFFQNLGLPEPHVFLNVGSDTHARQTARVMMGFEDVVRASVRFSLLLPVMSIPRLPRRWLREECIPIAHIESGLRSFDRSMPERSTE